MIPNTRTTYTIDERVAILDKLRHDGDTYDLPDGRMIRLRIEPDHDASINDAPDFYGRLADADRGQDRPHAFDGNAEKMWLQQNGGCVWWQPPKDVRRTDEGFAALRRLVNDVASFGFVGYVVELVGPETDADAYGHRPVVAFDSLWGIEAMVDDAYARTIIGELLDQVMGQ